MSKDKQPAFDLEGHRAKAKKIYEIWVTNGKQSDWCHVWTSKSKAIAVARQLKFTPANNHLEFSVVEVCIDSDLFGRKNKRVIFSTAPVVVAPEGNE